MNQPVKTTIEVALALKGQEEQLSKLFTENGRLIVYRDLRKQFPGVTTWHMAKALDALGVTAHRTTTRGRPETEPRRPKEAPSDVGQRYQNVVTLLITILDELCSLKVALGVKPGIPLPPPVQRVLPLDS
jgi:hypothetical protein